MCFGILSPKIVFKAAFNCDKYNSITIISIRFSWTTVHTPLRGSQFFGHIPSDLNP